MKKFDHCKNNPGEPGKNFKSKFRAITKKTVSEANFFRAANVTPATQQDQTANGLSDFDREFFNSLMEGTPSVGRVVGEVHLPEDVPLLVGANPNDGRKGGKEKDVPMAQELLDKCKELDEAAEASKKKGKKKTTSCFPSRSSNRLRDKAGESTDYGRVCVHLFPFVNG